MGVTLTRAGLFREGRRKDLCAKTRGAQGRAVGVKGKMHLASLGTGGSKRGRRKVSKGSHWGQGELERGQGQILAGGFLLPAWCLMDSGGFRGAWGGDPRGHGWEPGTRLGGWNPGVT